MKAYWGSRCIDPHTLELGTRWGRVVTFTPGRITPMEIASGIPIGYEAGWTPEPVWSQLWTENFPAPAGTQIPDHPARSPALYH